MVEKMVEKMEMDGKTAYSVAMENLETAWMHPEVLKKICPDKYFHLSGDDGDGLALPHKLVFISTPSVKEIKEVKGNLDVKDQTALTDLFTEFRSIGKKIPDKAISDVIKFTEDVKAKMSATHTSH
jgi:hypothetical protein